MKVLVLAFPNVPDDKFQLALDYCVSIGAVGDGVDGLVEFTEAEAEEITSIGIASVTGVISRLARGKEKS